MVRNYDALVTVSMNQAQVRFWHIATTIKNITLYHGTIISVDGHVTAVIEGLVKRRLLLLLSCDRRHRTVQGPFLFLLGVVTHNR